MPRYGVAAHRILRIAPILALVRRRGLPDDDLLARYRSRLKERLNGAVYPRSAVRRGRFRSPNRG
jgi:hypothetical protein